MSDTSGPTSYAPFAKWDRDSQSWKTSEATSLWALTLSSLTLPQWGGLHDGELSEHQTPERLTSGLDYSSLPTPTTQPTTGNGHARNLGTEVKSLPTPTVDDASNITRASGCYNSLTRAATALLPTPAVNDMGEGKTLEWWDDWAPRQKAADGRPAPHGRSLAIEAQRLLPTPAARDAKGPHMADRRGGLCLARTVGETTAPLLPTPRAQEPRSTTVGYGKSLIEAVTGKAQNGAITAPPLSDGSASSDDPHQHQLSLDVQGIPA